MQGRTGHAGSNCGWGQGLPRDRHTSLAGLPTILPSSPWYSTMGCGGGWLGATGAFPPGREEVMPEGGGGWPGPARIPGGRKGDGSAPSYFSRSARPASRVRGRVKNEPDLPECTHRQQKLPMKRSKAAEAPVVSQVSYGGGSRHVPSAPCALDGERCPRGWHPVRVPLSSRLRRRDLESGSLASVVLDVEVCDLPRFPALGSSW